MSNGKTVAKEKLKEKVKEKMEGRGLLQRKLFWFSLAVLLFAYFGIHPAVRYFCEILYRPL